MNTKEYNISLSETEKLELLKKSKLGTWYDGWIPYHIPINADGSYFKHCSNPRMVPTNYGFKCPSCQGEIGFNLQRIEEAPIDINSKEFTELSKKGQAEKIWDGMKQLNPIQTAECEKSVKERMLAFATNRTCRQK